MVSIDWVEFASGAVMRDPTQYPFGYLTRSSLPAATAQLFVWFESVEELTHFLLDVEPRAHDVVSGKELAAFQAAVRPLLDRVRQQGLTGELLKAVDAAGSKHFRIRWWGTFEELCIGRGEAAREVLDAYLGTKRAGQLLPASEVPAFVRFVQSYGT